MNKEELIQLLHEYEKEGWVVFAIPGWAAEDIVDHPVTQESMLELSARLKRDREEYAKEISDWIHKYAETYHNSQGYWFSAAVHQQFVKGERVDPRV